MSESETVWYEARPNYHINVAHIEQLQIRSYPEYEWPKGTGFFKRNFCKPPLVYYVHQIVFYFSSGDIHRMYAYTSGEDVPEEFQAEFSKIQEMVNRVHFKDKGEKDGNNRPEN